MKMSPWINFIVSVERFGNPQATGRPKQDRPNGNLELLSHGVFFEEELEEDPSEKLESV